MDVVSVVTHLKSLLAGDVVANMAQIEDAAQAAVTALSKGGNAEELQKSLLTLKKGPILRFDWMVNSDPASYLKNVLKGDIRVVLIAAFAGRPIAYPLLAIKRALETRYDPEDDSGITVTDLLGMIRGFDSQAKMQGPIDIIQSLSMDAAVRAPDMTLLEVMVPQVRVGATDFTPSTMTWSEIHKPINIPVPVHVPTTSIGGGGIGGNNPIIDGNRKGWGGAGTSTPTPVTETGDNNFTLLIIMLLLACIAAFAVGR